MGMPGPPDRRGRPPRRGDLDPRRPGSGHPGWEGPRAPRTQAARAAPARPPPGGRPPGGAGGPQPRRRQPSPGRSSPVAGSSSRVASRSPASRSFALDPLGGGGDGGPSVQALSGASPPPDPAKHTFDLVVRGGRVDGSRVAVRRVADVGIDGGTVTSIDPDGGLTGTTVLDAKGLVVAPGFIDILSYDPNAYGIWFKVADGVTTNLGAARPARACAGVLRHLGSRGAASADALRRRVQQPVRPREPRARHRRPRVHRADRRHGRRCADEDLRAGFMAVDFEPEYTPGVSFAEIKALAEVAKDHEVPATFHARLLGRCVTRDERRSAGRGARVARETGVACPRRAHHQHRRHVHDAAVLADARTGAARRASRSPRACTRTTTGRRISRPHASTTAGRSASTSRTSDLAIVGTGERLTASSFATYQAQNASDRGVRDPRDRRGARRCVPTG